MKLQVILEKYRNFEQKAIEEISNKYVQSAKKFLLKAKQEKKLPFNDIFGDKTRITLPYEDDPDDFGKEDKDDRKWKHEWDIFLKNTKESGYSLNFKKGLIFKTFDYTIPKGPKQGQIVKKTQEEKIGNFLSKLVQLAKKWDELWDNNYEQAVSYMQI